MSKNAKGPKYEIEMRDWGFTNKRKGQSCSEPTEAGYGWLEQKDANGNVTKRVEFYARSHFDGMNAMRKISVYELMDSKYSRGGHLTDVEKRLIARQICKDEAANAFGR